jgi:hypothetical protein
MPIEGETDTYIEFEYSMVGYEDTTNVIEFFTDLFEGENGSTYFIFVLACGGLIGIIIMISMIYCMCKCCKEKVKPVVDDEH